MQCVQRIKKNLLFDSYSTPTRDFFLLENVFPLSFYLETAKFDKWSENVNFEPVVISNGARAQ